uniref:Uncharacterized protein n=1 Tax=Anguilla anguilla TaxID=7936 RepID=A0A0E9VP76_ANGAN
MYLESILGLMSFVLYRLHFNQTR